MVNKAKEVAGSRAAKVILAGSIAAGVVGDKLGSSNKATTNEGGNDPKPAKVRDIPPEEGETLIAIQSRVESKLGISLVGPQSGVQEIWLGAMSRFETKAWNVEETLALEKELQALPRRLYTKKIQGGEESVAFALIDPISYGNGTSLEGVCSCAKREASLILVDANLAESLNHTDSINSYLARETLVHELTHVVTAPDIESYAEKIAYPIDIREFGDLRFTFSSARDNYRKIEQEWNANHDMSMSEYLDMSDQYQLWYGSSNMDEFISVAAEFYIRGENSFIKLYQPYLGAERTKLLYDNLKREIFEGKEFHYELPLDSQTK